MDARLVVQCQQCRCALEIAENEDAVATSSREGFGRLSAQMDESFMLLDEAMSRDRPGQVLVPSAASSARGVEESFVMLPQHTDRSSSASASLEGLGSRRIPLDDRISALTRVLELASQETAIDQPLCTVCTAEVERELQEQLEEVQIDIGAYEALAAQLQAAHQAHEADDEQQPDSELQRAQDEEAAAQEKLRDIKRQLAAAEAELAAVTAAAAYLDAAEERYWHAANGLALSTRAQMEERDEMAHRVRAAERNLATLQRTNIYEDVFKIWGDGPFGTISGLRLGRTPEHSVDWDEINAAWGQAVLLLDSLARALGVRFRGHRLQPRGSYSRIIDEGGSANELWGPVNKVMCPGYDRAQVGFLNCLDHFAKELAARGATDGGAPFTLKYPIEGDRIKGQSVRHAMSRDKAWTRALKYMLVDLKFCIKGTLELMLAPRGQLPVLPREGPLRRA